MELKLPVTLTVISPMHFRGVAKVPGDTIKIDDKNLVEDMQSAFASGRVVVTVTDEAKQKIETWKKNQAAKAEAKAAKTAPKK